MAYIRFLGEKTPHKATVIPTNNIVTVKFGTDVIENKNGFDLFLDKEFTIDIGGTFYQKFTTIYRNDSVTKKYNGYQLSNDGSVYVEPEISPNPKPYNPTLDEVKESKKAEIKMKVQNEILSDVMIASYAFGYNESDMIAIRNAYEDSISSGMSVILKDSTGQSRELNEEEITDLYKKQEIKRLEKESYAQCLLDYIDGLTSKEAVNSVEYGDELTGKYLEKYNEKVSNTQSYIEKVISGKKAVVDQAKIASLTNTDAQAVEVKGLYADWEDDPDGYAYDVQNQKDKRRNFGGFLWNLNKNHQKQKDRFPGAEPTLWTQLVEGYEGSYSDPIPVPDSVNVSGFEYEYGKYYIENELVYLCKRGGVLNPESMYGQKEKLYFKPSALIGQYFEIA
ncbi:hypothetical protein [[Ruminococcus] torques]|uniref:hypothetical protein n=1 Tax=[Ruminococcus] torques TaxID=33039 RepID=UPI0032C09E34